MLKSGMTPARCTTLNYDLRDSQMHAAHTFYAFIDAAKKEPLHSLSRSAVKGCETIIKTDRPSPTKLTFSLSFVPQSNLFLHLFSRAQVVSEPDG